MLVGLPFYFIILYAFYRGQQQIQQARSLLDRDSKILAHREFNMGESPDSQGFINQWESICQSRLMVNLSTTPEILESALVARITQQDGHIRFIIGALTFLGLLGTFIGMSIAVYSISNIMDAAGTTLSVETFPQLIKSINQPLSAMSMAFSTSVLGLVTALILGFLFTRYQRERAAFYESAMTYANQVLIPQFAPKTVDTQFHDLIDSNRTAFDAFQDRIATALSESQTQQQQFLTEFYNRHVEGLEKQQQQIDTELETVRTDHQRFGDQLASQISTMIDHFSNYADRVMDRLQTTDDIVMGLMEEQRTSSKVMQESVMGLQEASNKFNEHISNFVRLSEPIEQLNKLIQDQHHDLAEIVIEFRNVIQEDVSQKDNLSRVTEGLGAKLDTGHRSLEALIEQQQKQHDHFNRSLQSYHQMLQTHFDANQGRIQESIDQQLRLYDLLNEKLEAAAILDEIRSQKEVLSQHQDVFLTQRDHLKEIQNGIEKGHEQISILNKLNEKLGKVDNMSDQLHRLELVGEGIIKRLDANIKLAQSPRLSKVSKLSQRLRFWK